jgi:hypothetical protein
MIMKYGGMLARAGRLSMAAAGAYGSMARKRFWRNVE